jgi:hypothetical protein
MLNICDNCGAYRPDKIIDPSRGQAICPECEHPHSVLLSPLLLVTGACGTGKSTVCRRLKRTVPHVVPLDSDVLWGPHFEAGTPGLSFFETWLRMCKNVAQAGRPVVLFGAGTGVPDNIERCTERRYFTTLHYLALTCDDEALAARLRRRPGWRNSDGETFLEGELRFNRWFKEKGPALSIDLIDTTVDLPEQSTEKVVAWIRRKLAR